MDKVYEVQADFGDKRKKWVTIEKYTRFGDAIHHVRTRGAADGKYRFRIVRIIKSVVFEEK